MSRHTDKIRHEEEDVLVRLIIRWLFHNGTYRPLWMAIHWCSIRRPIRNAVCIIHARLLTCYCPRSGHAVSSRRMVECDKLNGACDMDTALTPRPRGTRGLSNGVMSALRLPSVERAIVADFRGFAESFSFRSFSLSCNGSLNRKWCVRNRFVEKRCEQKSC